MKQLLYDYVHCTDLEFLIKHPVANSLAIIILLLISSIIILFIRRKK